MTIVKSLGLGLTPEKCQSTRTTHPRLHHRDTLDQLYLETPPVHGTRGSKVENQDNTQGNRTAHSQQ